LDVTIADEGWIDVGDGQQIQVVGLGQVPIINGNQNSAANNAFRQAVESEFRARLAANGIDLDSVELVLNQGCDADAVISIENGSDAVVSIENG